MISGFWFLIIFISILALPLLYGMLRDNSNRFYGDELNKQRRTKKERLYDKAYEKTARYYDGQGSGGDGGDD
ncbi:hypothetical protein [Halobacillus sp. K22]|uniref:hypothetical protein n=1 Tax=Halobacillus sp. K22 TaxID=3457431 RepID=UPI003FCD60FE